jgi:PEP-CTERM motif
MSVKTSRLNKLFLGCAATLLLPLTSFAVTTGSYSPTGSPFNTGMTHTDKDTTFNVNTFDEQLGTLTSVTLTLTFISDTSFSIQNENNSHSEAFKNATATFSPSATLKYPGEPKLTIDDPTTKIGPEKGTLAPGATDYFSGKYTTITDPFAVPSSDFSDFESATGSTKIPITVDLLEDIVVKGNGSDVFFGANDCLQAYLSVDYTYAFCDCSCPEPSTSSMGLIGLAFGGLFFGRRLLKRSVRA